MKSLLANSCKVLGLAILFISVCWPIEATTVPAPSFNNKVGIGLLSPDSEIPEAALMVNTNGDWGWVTIVIKKSERNTDRWQGVMHKLTEHHLIPIVRIATDFGPDGIWQKPSEDDAKEWAEFLSKLYWPTKNKYIQVYNEVNQAREWGGEINPEGYAKELQKTIIELKAKDKNFFVLNSPLDLSLPTSETSLSALDFLNEMEEAVSGIFSNLDGWASHSYPNPNFTASPLASGRISVRGYEWELQQIGGYLRGKELSVFITETGWRRDGGVGGGLSEEAIGQNYKVAFEEVWRDEKVIAVTPFIFSYPDDIFYQFSFKTKEAESSFHRPYFAIRDLLKTSGLPERENLVSSFESNIPSLLIVDNSVKGSFVLKNGGNYIWNLQDECGLDFSSDSIELSNLVWGKKKVYPGESSKVDFFIKSFAQGDFTAKVIFRCFDKSLMIRDISLESKTFFTLILEQIGIKIGDNN